MEAYSFLIEFSINEIHFLLFIYFTTSFALDLPNTKAIITLYIVIVIILWSKEEQNFAISLYFKSPTTYRFLLEKLTLPAPSTLREWVASSSKYMTGFNDLFFQKLALKVSVMSHKCKDCVILFDEMSLMANFEYSNSMDIIEGFEDLGHLGRTKNAGKYASVFLVRGMQQNWKITVAYFISEKGLSGTQIKTILYDLIEKVLGVGLSPHSFICDQGSSNRKALKDMGVSFEKPYFEVKNRKIYCIFDVPHLVKSLRNNLLTCDFVADGKIISFENIRRVYRSDTSSSTTRAMWKLTPAHLWPNAFQKMSVRLATQLFSLSVAAAIRASCSTGELTLSSASSTADFIELINNIFDVLNCKMNVRLCDSNMKSMDLLHEGFRIMSGITK